MANQFDTVLRPALPVAPHTGNATTLALLLPNELPAEILLSPSDKRHMCRVLRGFLSALRLPDPHVRATALNDLLHQTPAPMGVGAVVGGTGIPTKADEVEDFDRYFNVTRTTGEDPAAVLLRGLLQTAASVLGLVARASCLPSAQVDQQVAGFAAYAHLLGRLCGLDDLS